jgi:hypothetical protein
LEGLTSTFDHTTIQGVGRRFTAVTMLERTRQNVNTKRENIRAVVITLLIDIKFVRIPAHVTRIFDPALTREDASLKSIHRFISKPRRPHNV